MRAFFLHIRSMAVTASFITLFASWAPGADSDAVGSPFGFHPAGIYYEEYRGRRFDDALNIGVRWHREGFYVKWYVVQPDLEEDAYDFSRNDYYFSLVPPDIHILGNINNYTPINPDYVLDDSWYPVDEEKYLAFVRAVVERYDGDGIDDMPGLENPIHYWQVGNEPNDQNRSDFAALQRIAYEAIKEADPEAVVLAGGFLSSPRNFIELFDLGYTPIVEALAGSYADGFDIHWAGTATGDYRMRDTKTGGDVIDHIRGVLTNNGFSRETQIWITEMSAYSGDPEEAFYAFQSERQQAADYFKRFIFPILLGVSKVFPAFGLMEGLELFEDAEVKGRFYEHTGIIYNGIALGDPGMGIKKLAYYSYKKMTEMLDGAEWDTLTMLHDGTDSDHIYLFSIEKDGALVYIAWWDHFDEPDYAAGDTRSLLMSGFAPGTLNVESVVPWAETGREVVSYDTAFAAADYGVEDGSVTVVLGVDPVIMTFAEETSPSTTTTTTAVATTTSVPVEPHCPLEQAIVSPGALDELRAVRDLMRSTPDGAGLVDAYYSNAQEVSSIMRKHPHIREALRDIVVRHRTLARPFVQGRAGTVPEDLRALLRQLTKKGSPTLKKDIDAVLQILESGPLGACR